MPKLSDSPSTELAVSQPRTALLAIPNASEVGGPAMRLRALRNALAQHGGCSVLPLSCNHWQECWRHCRATGRAHSTAGGQWYYGRAFCPDYAEQLTRELVEYGVSTVVCSGLEAARYVPVLAASSKLTVVFDMHNVEWILQKAIRDDAAFEPEHAALYEDESIARTAAVELAATRSAAEVWTCSATDRDQVAACYPDVGLEKVRVVPNTVEIPGTEPPVEDDLRAVCFTGRFDYHPNLRAAHTLAFEIAPLLQESGVPLPVVIAGAWARKAFAGARVPRNVRLVSNPEDISRVIRHSVMAVPLKIGSGSRFKLLEAFALGAPVVSTGKGAEGLSAAAGEHYLPAESPEEFAAAVENLIHDAGSRVRMVRAARQLVEREFSAAALSRVVGAFFADRG